MPDPTKEKKPEQSSLRTFGLFGLIVSDLLLCTGVGIGAGYYAQKQFGAPAWVILITGSAGLALAFYRIYRYAKKEFG